jgi:hypothetical protein
MADIESSQVNMADDTCWLDIHRVVRDRPAADGGVLAKVNRLLSDGVVNAVDRKSNESHLAIASTVAAWLQT